MLSMVIIKSSATFMLINLLNFMFKLLLLSQKTRVVIVARRKSMRFIFEMDQIKMKFSPKIDAHLWCYLSCFDYSIYRHNLASERYETWEDRLVSHKPSSLLSCFSNNIHRNQFKSIFKKNGIHIQIEALKVCQRFCNALKSIELYHR